MLVCVRVCIYVGIARCKVHACLWRPEVDVQGLLSYTPPSSFEAAPITESDTHWLVAL